MRIHPSILFLVSGLLFFIPFVFSVAYWSYLPAFVLLLFGVAKESSYKKLFAYGLCVGALLHGGAFYWVWSTFPILWMTEAPVWAHVLAIGTYWVLTSSVMGVSVGLFVLLIKRNIFTPLWIIICAPFVWVLTEILKSFLFSVYTLGDGSFLNIGLSYGYVGYLLAEIPLFLQASVFAGVYGLSYIAALLGTLAYVLCAHSFPHTKAAIATFCVLMVGVSFIPVPTFHRHEVLGKNVIVIEGWFKNVDEEFKKDEVRKAMEIALTYDPDVILMPEDMRFGDSFTSADAFFVWMDERTQRKDVVLVDNGLALDARGKQVLRTFIYDTETRSAYFFDKRYLVPQGEFMSYVHKGILSLFVSHEEMEKIEAFARFETGVVNDSRAFPDHLPGVLFCFETMVPFGVKRAEHFRNPAFIAHPISHAWFQNPFSLETQLAQMLKISAVWNNVPVVSAGSMTESRAYLETGETDTGELLHEEAFWKIRRFSL